MYSFLQVLLCNNVAKIELKHIDISISFRYNSGAKSFSEVTSTKHLSVSIDAVVLHNSVWKTGKPPIAKH